MQQLPSAFSPVCGSQKQHPACGVFAMKASHCTCTGRLNRKVQKLLFGGAGSGGMSFGQDSGCLITDILLTRPNRQNSCLRALDSVLRRRSPSLGLRSKFCGGLGGDMSLCGIYILYRPKSSSLRPSSHPRSCSAVGPSGGPVVFSFALSITFSAT